MTRLRDRKFRTTAALVLVGLTTSGCSFSFSGMWDSITAFFGGGKDEEVAVAAQTPQTKMLPTGTHCVKDGKYLLLTPAFCAKIGGAMASSGEEAAAAHRAPAQPMIPQQLPTQHMLGQRFQAPRSVATWPTVRQPAANAVHAQPGARAPQGMTHKPVRPGASQVTDLPTPTAPTTGGDESRTAAAARRVQERASVGLRSQPGDYRPDDYKAALPARLTARPFATAPASATQRSPASATQRSVVRQPASGSVGMTTQGAAAENQTRQPSAEMPAIREAAGAPVTEMQNGQVFQGMTPSAAAPLEPPKPYRILQHPQAAPLRPIPAESIDPRAEAANPTPSQSSRHGTRSSDDDSTEIWRPNTLGSLSTRGYRNLGFSRGGRGLYGGAASY